MLMRKISVGVLGATLVTMHALAQDMLPQSAPGPASGQVAPQEPTLQPVFVRPLFAEIGKGHNDSSPSWAYGGGMLAIERAEESKREIVIVRTDGTVVKNVYYQTEEDDQGLGALLPGLATAVSYNSGITWSKAGDKFVFMSNAGEGNYDLYLGMLDGKGVQRLTTDPQKDGEPDWSPAGGTVVFVSGREGSAHLYLMDVASKKTERISMGDRSCFYPRWSQDGKRIAATCGANENHDIIVFDGLPDMTPPPPPAKGARPDTSEKTGAPAKSADAKTSAANLPPPKPPVEHAFTTWRYDDLSPAWSPDGKHIAFYSNYNPEGDPKVWSLLVIEADGSSPTEGDKLAARVVAYNVVPDVALGPAWLPDSKHIAYVHNGKQDYSPIYVVDVNTRKEARLETGTNINHDLAISSDGVLAFRAQVEQWDQIFLVKFPEVNK
jgi:Tol biopolymer transport system component